MTQVLSLLHLVPEAQEMTLALGDPIKGRRLGIHTLWSLACLPAEEQLNRIEAIAR